MLKAIYFTETSVNFKRYSFPEHDKFTFNFHALFFINIMHLQIWVVVLSDAYH
jgi:hypothetical protein